jgi:hypothetical protein
MALRNMLLFLGSLSALYGGSCIVESMVIVIEYFKMFFGHYCQREENGKDDLVGDPCAGNNF